jgi:hypothetical protein
MNLEKFKEKVNSAEVVEELVVLSEKVFGKCSDEVKVVVEIFIEKSYLMGKQNQIKAFNDI